MIKLLPLIKELQINNPVVTSLEQITTNDNYWSYKLKDEYQDDIDNFISKFKTLIKFNKSKYDKVLNQFIKSANRPYIVIKDEITDELKNYDADKGYYIGKISFNKIKLICNTLKIEFKNIHLISGLFFIPKLESNIHQWRTSKTLSSSSSFVYLKIGNLVFFANGRTWYILTPSQKIISLKDININNQKDKRTNSKQISDSLPKWWKNEVVIKITGLENNIVYFDIKDNNQNQIFNKGNIKYDTIIKKQFGSNKYTYANKCILTLDQPINGINVSFRKKEISLLIMNEPLKIGSRLSYSIFWSIETYLKKQTNNQIEPVDNDAEITKWINELQIDKLYRYNKQEDWDLESLKNDCGNDITFHTAMSGIKRLNLPTDKPFKVEYIANRLSELGANSDGADTMIDFLLKYKMIK